MEQPHLTKPITNRSNSHEEMERLLRLYGKTSKDKFNQITDVAFATWVADNIGNIERLMMFIQRETARPATTLETDANLNAHMLAQSQILNRMYEIAESGTLYKETL